MANEYATLGELKNHVLAAGGASFTAADDTNLNLALGAASRWLDDHFDTSFYPRTETHTLTAEYGDLLYVPDLLSVTSIKTDDNDDGTYETTWTTTDYWLEPRNAALGPQVRPYRQVRARANGNYRFPTGVEYGVEVIGSWGYCTVANRPAVIKETTLLIAHRLWRRKDAIFGVAGAPALGVQVIQARIQADNDIVMLLEGIDTRAF